MNKEIAKRLTIDISKTQHKELKEYVAKKDITLRLWVLEAIAEKMTREKSLENICF